MENLKEYEKYELRFKNTMLIHLKAFILQRAHVYEQQLILMKHFNIEGSKYEDVKHNLDVCKMELEETVSELNNFKEKLQMNNEKT